MGGWGVIMFKLGVEGCGKGQECFHKCAAFGLGQKHGAVGSTAPANICVLRW